ncbi:DUF58 domain-containing protein [Stenotrophomonas tumulicola]|uniref:DUF58 domain-containing protein n=1 Tax=Stenotrophomonas tumulicola TaxID=1685415 RepID=A0A7W3FPS2_9GAMM|nr:DUF58 domain-containing protein [Stenotrophomonas tumulicola]MBA8683433.1 DUF58 domain-containing protein [Stenotrophomonas tumulicola]
MQATDPSQAVHGDGLVPSLAELVALRGSAVRPPAPRRGRVGHAGQAPSALRGRGMEYAESREYVAGDDARHIDWRVTARSGRAHTKLFQAERERVSLIVADTDPALYFGTRTRFKSVQAARVGAVAAWSAQRRGDRLAALRGSVVEAPIPPASGTRGVLRVLDALTRWYAHPPEEDAGLEHALQQAARVLRPGARMLVLADPQRAQAIPAARWAGLAQHHEIDLLLMVDPLELQPPSDTLDFIAGQQRVRLDLRNAQVREQWQDRFVQPLDQLQRLLAARRVAVHVIATDAPSAGWLAPDLPQVPT